MRKAWQFLMIFIFLALVQATLLAQGGLMVTPQRIEFEGRLRAQAITLFNRGDSEMTYRLFFVEKRMTGDGMLKDLEPAVSGAFTSPMVRFSPRRVTLPPGQSQTVRLLLRAPSDLAAGEYRSHLVFQVVPREGGLHLDGGEGGPAGVGVRLTPLFGASIPIIVRRGSLDAEVRVVAAERSDEQTLDLRFSRSGNRSVYGDVRVSFKPRSGDPVDVGFVRGMAIYTDIDERTLRMTLRPPSGVDLADGRLVVDYAPQGGGPSWARQEFAMP